MQKRGTHPNCTVVLMETGWYPWVAVSVVLATRRWMATAGVRSVFGFLLILEHNSELKLEIQSRNQMVREKMGRRDEKAMQKQISRASPVICSSLSLQNCYSLLSF